MEIQWKSDDNVGVVGQSVLLSTDGGVTYSDLSGPLDGTANSFLWTVPRLATMEALIRVVAVDRAGNQGMDDSDGKFTIQFPMKEAIKDKEGKEHWEGKDVWEKDERELSSQPIGVVPPMERLARLEAALGQLMHFIRPKMRPDLYAAALKGERDSGGDCRAALSQLLHKQASDAKQAKDTKDVKSRVRVRLVMLSCKRGLASCGQSSALRVVARRRCGDVARPVRLDRCISALGCPGPQRPGSRAPGGGER